MKQSILTSLTLTAMLLSCRTEQTLTQTAENNYSERFSNNENTLVYQRDSIIIRQTDTILMETRSRDRIIEHTILLTDTLEVEVERIVEKQVEHTRRIIPRWCWLCLAYAGILTLCLILYWLFRLIHYLRQRFGR